jgi:ribonuclease HII
LDGNVNIRTMGVEHLNFPEADLHVPAVSAASVLGKFTHDRHMGGLAKEYPGYGFANNVGYHSKEHLAGIEKKGLCPAHRRSYVPTDKLRTAEEMAQADDEGIVVDE